MFTYNRNWSNGSEDKHTKDRIQEKTMTTYAARNPAHLSCSVRLIAGRQDPQMTKGCPAVLPDWKTRCFLKYSERRIENISQDPDSLEAGKLKKKNRREAPSGSKTADPAAHANQPGGEK